MDLRKHENFAKTLKNLFWILSNTVRIPEIYLSSAQKQLSNFNVNKNYVSTFTMSDVRRVHQMETS